MFKFRYALFLTCFWIGVFSFFILPLHFNRLDFDYRQVGMLVGAISVGAIIGRLVNSRLFSFFSIRKLVRAALLLFCVLALSMIFTTHFLALLVILLIFGYCISVVDLSTPEWVFIHYSEEDYSVGYNFIQIWPAVSIAVAPLVGGYIYLQLGSTPFFLMVGVCFLCGLLMSFTIILPGHSRQQSISIFSRYLYKKVNLIVYLIMFLHLLVLGTNNTFVILHLDELHLLENPGMFFTVGAVGISLSRITGVYIFQKTRGFLFLMPLFFLIALAQFLLPTLYIPAAILFLSFFMGFCEGFIIPALMSVVSRYNKGYQRYSIAIIFIMLDVGIIAGNLFGGQVAFLLDSIVYTLMLLCLFELVNMALVFKYKKYFSEDGLQ